MKNIDELIENLKSSGSSIRDAAAINLLGIGDARAIQPLIQAIRTPENVNHRGGYNLNQLHSTPKATRFFTLVATRQGCTKSLHFGRE